MSEFEKMLAKKMEEASIKDVAPLYDKEGDWQKLSAKLKPVRSLPLLRWIPYAAALLLIGLVSGLLIRRGSAERNNITHTYTTAKTIVIHDTVTVDRIAPVVTVQPAKSDDNHSIKKPLIIDKQHPADQIKREPGQYPADTHLTNNYPTEIADNAKHRVHAVNLLDIDNEDSRMLAQQARQPKRQDLFSRLFPACATGNNQGVTKTTIINLFKP